MAVLEPKASGEVRDYRFDWSPFLGDDTIQTSDVTATGVTLDNATNDTTSATYWLSGGTSGTTARITNTITTLGGRTETEVHTLAIRDAAEPVSLAKAKDHIEVSDDSKDELIAGYIVAARELVENYTGRILVRRQVTEYWRGFTTFFQLRHGPVVAGSVALSYSDGGLIAEPIANIVTNNREPVRIFPPFNTRWPVMRPSGEVVITYTAGYAEGEAPQAMIQAMLLLIAEFYQNREAGSLSCDAESAVAGILRSFRRRTL